MHVGRVMFVFEFCSLCKKGEIVLVCVWCRGVRRRNAPSGMISRI